MVDARGMTAYREVGFRGSYRFIPITVIEKADGMGYQPFAKAPFPT